MKKAICHLIFSPKNAPQAFKTNGILVDSQEKIIRIALKGHLVHPLLQYKCEKQNKVAKAEIPFSLLLPLSQESILILYYFYSKKVILISSLKHLSCISSPVILFLSTVIIRKHSPLTFTTVFRHFKSI